MSKPEITNEERRAYRALARAARQLQRAQEKAAKADAAARHPGGQTAPDAGGHRP